MLPKKVFIIALVSASVGAGVSVAAHRLAAMPMMGQTAQQPMSCMGSGPGMQQPMMGMQVTSEFGYLSEMIPHHQEAIATAQIIAERSDRPEMKAFANEIIRTQTAEIERMQGWLNQWYPNQQSTHAYVPMMRDLSQLRGDDLDQAFLEDMRMHHMGAVMMSQSLLNHNLVQHNEVRELAEGIRTTQHNEIRQMQVWLADWFGVTGMMGGHGNGHHGGGMMGCPQSNNPNWNAPANQNQHFQHHPELERTQA